jgi:hypothetical protein
VLGLEAELEQGLGDGRDVGRGGGQEQVDDALAGQAGHGRAAHVLGWGGRPAAGDEGDQAPGGLGGLRVGLVDLDRHPPVAADRWLRWRGRADLGSARQLVQLGLIDRHDILLLADVTTGSGCGSVL